MLKTNENRTVEFMLQCQPGQPVTVKANIADILKIGTGRVGKRKTEKK